MPRFTFWAHLRSRAAALGVLVPLELLLYLVLSVTATSADLTILVCVLVAGAAVLALVLDFLRVRRFWEGLSDLAESLDNPRLLPSLIKEPGFSEGDVAYAALDSVARSANEEVAEYRRHVARHGWPARVSRDPRGLAGAHHRPHEPYHRGRRGSGHDAGGG